MATKAELQALCVRVAEEYLSEHDVSEFFAAEYDEVTAVKADSDVPILSGVRFGSDEEFPLSLSHTRIDFAVYAESESLRAGLADCPLSYAESSLSTDADPVRLPMLAAEVVGEDYTQQHLLSTGEMEFPPEESPYVCRTDLVHLPREGFGRLPVTMLISDFPSELVPVRADVDATLAADGGIEAEWVRESLGFQLEHAVHRASQGEVGADPFE
jgi:hypothetical protein